jgi:hypothetical protein
MLLRIYTHGDTMPTEQAKRSPARRSELSVSETIDAAQAWHDAMNTGLQTGARVLCHWKSLIGPTTAPGCYRGPYLAFSPRTDYEVCLVEVARTGSHSLPKAMVRPEVVPTRSGDGAGFHARVRLPVPSRSYLVLDHVKLEALKHWVDALQSVPCEWLALLEEAHRILSHEQALQSLTIKALMAHIRKNPVLGAATDEETVRQAVERWRAREHGAFPPQPNQSPTGFSQWARLMMDSLAREKRQESHALIELAEGFGRTLGCKPLRLQLNASGRAEVWLTVPDVDQDDRLGPWVWCDRWMFQPSRGGEWRFNSQGRTPRRDVLPTNAHSSVTVIHEWEHAAPWRGRVSPGLLSHDQRLRLMALIENSVSSWNDSRGFWGEPGVIFEAFGQQAVTSTSLIGARLIGSLYRPQSDDIVGLVAVNIAPLLDAYRHADAPLRRAIEVWASLRRINLQAEEPAPVVHVVSGTTALKLFEKHSILQLRGATKHLSEAIDRRALALNQLPSGSVRYMPAPFVTWLRRWTS